MSRKAKNSEDALIKMLDKNSSYKKDDDFDDDLISDEDDENINAK